MPQSAMELKLTGSTRSSCGSSSSLESPALIGAFAASNNALHQLQPGAGCDMPPEHGSPLGALHLQGQVLVTQRTCSTMHYWTGLPVRPLPLPFWQGSRRCPWGDGRAVTPWPRGAVSSPYLRASLIISKVAETTPGAQLLQEQQWALFANELTRFHHQGHEGGTQDVCFGCRSKAGRMPVC